MSFASGKVAPELSAEFPGLRLDWTALDARVRRRCRQGHALEVKEIQAGRQNYRQAQQCDGNPFQPQPNG